MEMLFEVGRIYDRRRDLHVNYGGQQQGGISTPSEHPMIFIFTGDSGTHYGYEDGWDDDGVFCYTGEGQRGNIVRRSIPQICPIGADVTQC